MQFHFLKNNNGLVIWFRSGEAELVAEGRDEKVALSLEKAINLGLTKNAESREPVSVGEGSKLAMPVNLNAAAATAQSSQVRVDIFSTIIAE